MVRDLIFGCSENSLVVYCDDPDKLFLKIHKLKEKHIPSGIGIIDIDLDAFRDPLDIAKEKHNAAQKKAPDILPDPHTTHFCQIEIVRKDAFNTTMRFCDIDGGIVFECPVHGLNSEKDLPLNPKQPNAVIVSFVAENMQGKDLTKTPHEHGDEGMFFLASMEILRDSFKFKN